MLSNISTAISSESGAKTTSNTSRQGGSWWEPGDSANTQAKQVVDKDTVLLPDQLRLAVEVVTYVTLYFVT